LIARGVALEVIHHYKYRRALWFEPFLAEALVSRARPELLSGDWQAIVPVPLHPTKQREREFNQAERLARQLSHATGIPLCKRWLRRVRPTRTQTQLSREERQENMKDAFAWRGNEQLHGSRVVLVDDVFTTGATTNACAKVLRQAGASEIVVWTLARGL
jgi:ComF family protein